MATERNVNYDVLRIISMFFVICIHTDRSFINNSAIAILFNTILFSCNAIFYMISGRFNLSKTFQGRNDYQKFYKRKLISILFPYAFVTGMLSLWNLYKNNAWNGIVPWIKTVYVDFMYTNANNHLWFMYPLIGMLISTPFLAKMLQSMSDWELKLLFTIAMGWNVISIYLTKDFNIKFSYSGWILSGWIISFFAGYYCHRIINDSNKRKLYVCGLLGCIATVLCQVLLPDNFFNALDLSPMYIIYVMALFTFIEKKSVIKSQSIKNVIGFLARHSFMIYMVHWNVLLDITPKIVDGSSSIYDFLASVMVTFVISLVGAVLLDLLIMKPIQAKIIS